MISYNSIMLYFLSTEFIGKNVCYVVENILENRLFSQISKYYILVHLKNFKNKTIITTIMDIK